MKQFFIITLMIFCHWVNLAAQDKNTGKQRSRLGIKGGYNIARITGQTADFKPDTKNGFMLAASYSPASRKGFGFKTELVFSRQGFGFTADRKTNTINVDYIYLPQFTTFGIGKFLQLQIGAQAGYLLRSTENAGSSKKQNLTSLMNRFDYGAAGGIEIFPYKGIIMGGRYNMNFGKSFKTASTEGGIINPFPFNPSDIKSGNAVINFYLGYQF